MEPINKDGIRTEVVFAAVRSRGPGGQNVNKVSSAAILTWNFHLSQFLSIEQKSIVTHKLEHLTNKFGELQTRSDEFRDLPRNKERCLEKLFEMLRKALHKPKARRATKPTFASKVKTRESKKRRGEVKKLRRKVEY